MLIAGGYFVILHQLGWGTWNWLSVPMHEVGIALLVLAAAGFAFVLFDRRRKPPPS